MHATTTVAIPAAEQRASVLTPRGYVVRELIRADWLRNLSAGERRLKLDGLCLQTVAILPADREYLTDLVAAHQGA